MFTSVITALCIGNHESIIIRMSLLLSLIFIRAYRFGMLPKARSEVLDISLADRLYGVDGRMIIVNDGQLKLI
jgi:hypothetical protein